MEVLGRDRMREAYRVRALIGGQDVEGWVPEALWAAVVRADGPRHQGAYEWLARHRADVTAALAARLRGRAPRPPYDVIDLSEES
jgi:hypothetical protein